MTGESMRLEPFNLWDFEARAKQVLPPHIWDFIECGAWDEITVKRNRAALDAAALRPRFLVDVSELQTSTTVLGKKISFPVMIAPAGGLAVIYPDAELAIARAVGAAGTMMGLSMFSHNTIEEVAEAASTPLWYQLFHCGKEIDEIMVRRAEEAGYAAICLCVDIPIRDGGFTQRDSKNKLDMVMSPELKNFRGKYAEMIAGPGNEKVWNFQGRLPFEPPTWKDVEWLRSITPLPLVIKGIRTAEDAKLCVESGAEAIVVSNHGAKQIDGTLSSIETMPEIADAVGGSLELYMDSGVRRGADVLRALALGARAVFIGRPQFWGLAVDGEAGVRGVLDILRRELELAMAYCGVTDVENVNRGVVALPGESGWVTGGWERFAKRSALDATVPRTSD